MRTLFNCCCFFPFLQRAVCAAALIEMLVVGGLCSHAATISCARAAPNQHCWFKTFKTETKFLRVVIVTVSSISKQDKHQAPTNRISVRMSNGKHRAHQIMIIPTFIEQLNSHTTTTTAPATMTRAATTATTIRTTTAKATSTTTTTTTIATTTARQQQQPPPQTLTRP